ncbi:hypothetical protein PR003_g28401 [Phytophthora rubi]|uniref:Uncharacterized protein n=1 Tax=Phytophthora rubi TaxID=129364 RepID=A0A6A3GYS9_9STRA|nr:hypothetical protein PR002_g29657 [Phytophthora rubi]KAE9278843.1 hypothetical protein PR003_g28401 [Phytophthora rubi]
MSDSAITRGENLASSPPALGSIDAHQGSQDRSARFCKELLRSRLQQIEAMEEKLEKVAKYSMKLLNAQEKLAMMLSHEKEDIIRLAAAAGAPAHDVGYVMSYVVALEQCCNILLDN